jgi:uncharacterized protein (TIGR00299 family) protein
MRIAYFDCFSGISGDMCLGALVDAGVPFDVLKEGLEVIGLEPYRISRKRTQRGGFSSTKIDVLISGKEPPRRFSDISEIIGTSRLTEKIKRKGLKIFRRLFEAEAKVHGGKLREVHLHELSGTDCMIDIIGTLLCLDYLGTEEVVASPLNLGGGTVSTEHGLLPVPAPATAELLKDIPAYSSGAECELTTPTGAAIISEIASSYGPFPEMTFDLIGHGAGSHLLKDRANLLRVFVGTRKSVVHVPAKKGLIEEKLVTIETNIDDMNPQIYEFLLDRLMSEGALDVFFTPIIMKKSRPAIILTVLCYPERKNACIDLLLRETTTLGVRFFETGRICLKRKIEEVETEFGKVRFKVVTTGKLKKAVPEYEDCRRIAQTTGLPLMEIMKRLSQTNVQLEGE